MSLCGLAWDLNKTPKIRIEAKMSQTIEQYWAHEEALPGLAHMYARHGQGAGGLGGRGGNPQYPGTTHYWTDDHTEQLIRRHAGTGGGARILSPMALTLTIRTSTFSPV